MAEPQLRFKKADGTEYSEWGEVALSDIATRVTRKNKGNITDIPLTISSADGLIDQRDFFNKVVASKDMSGYYLLKKGEFAYNKSYSNGYDYGSIKRLNLYENGALSSLYICFALNEGQNSDFYQKYFDSLCWYPEVNKICAEGARNHGLLNVPVDGFFDIKLTVPSEKDEQQKIAEFLSNVDEIIAASEQEVENLEMQKKAVMKKIFSQEVRFKKPDGSDFPEWEEIKVSEAGKVVTGNTPPTKDNANYGGDFLWVTPTDISNEPYISKSGRFLTETGKRKARYLPKDSVLVTCIASIGKNCILAKEGSCNQQINAIIPNEKMVPYFIFLCMNYRKHELELLGGNGGMKIVSKGLFEEFTIPYPHKDEQKLIADFLASFDEVIVAAREELAKWKELKKGLLQQMFV